MRKDLLLKLADLLEADAVNPEGIKFDLAVWADLTHPNWSDKIPMDCGTKACALGLAAISGIFEGEGLTMGPVFPTLLKDGTRYTGYHAATHLFELTENDMADSVYLFSPSAYSGDITGAPAELQVAKRIRDLVTSS